MKPLACQELVELVTDYLEGALSAAEMERFEQHLTECNGCGAYLDQIRTTIALTGRLTSETIPPAARDELLHVFSTWNAARGIIGAWHHYSLGPTYDRRPEAQAVGPVARIEPRAERRRGFSHVEHRTRRGTPPQAQRTSLSTIALTGRRTSETIPPAARDELLHVFSTWNAARE